MSELDQYDYDLPRDLIAQQPLAHRSDARMMVVARAEQAIDHAHVRDLTEYLRAGDCLVLNDTRVLKARLVGYRAMTRGRWSGLFLGADSAGHWQVMSKTRGKLQVGETVVLQDRTATEAFSLVMMANLGEGIWAARPEAAGSPVELLEQVGRVPLPPYIRGGEMLDEDIDRYQTVFAEQPGAIAAPTAGLHFTEDLLAQLAAVGIQLCHVTLHVGVGTFRPINVRSLSDHQMHGEWGQIDELRVEQLRACRQRGGRIVAVGTTCVRLLETAARQGELRPWQGVTDLFVRPPFTFHAVDALLTNFHLPRSTLLVLARTFAGDELMRRAYDVAIEERYRFYSYGDAMLIL